MPDTTASETNSFTESEHKMCLRCHDLGEFDGCPSCGKVRHFGVSGTSVAPVDSVATSVIIPESYKSIEWNKDILIQSHPDRKDDKRFKRYVEQLDKLCSIFMLGNIPQTSLIIIAPPKYAKVTLAYSCIKCAISNGMSVLPLLDNTQLKRINVLSAERPRSEYLRDLPTMTEVTTLDVLFMTVDKDNYSSSFKTMESVLDKRSRYGKPTIIISRYTLQEMDAYDYNQSWRSMVDVTRFNNKYKYPAILNVK
jgi:hypothetical protein